jgi:hypothetical protein
VVNSAESAGITISTQTLIKPSGLKKRNLQYSKHIENMGINGQISQKCYLEGKILTENKFVDIPVLFYMLDASKSLIRLFLIGLGLIIALRIIFILQ